MTPRSLLRETAKRFRDAGIPDPETDSALLLSFLTGLEPLRLRLDTDTELPPGILRNYDALVGRRLVLSRVIDREDNDLSQLAIFAAGRILKEEAVLAWDERASVCILWQDVSDNADGAELTHFFEAFMDSCDWWLARAVELNAPPVHFPDIVIRP